MANSFAAIFPLYLFRVTGRLLEDDRADSIYQNAIFEMPTYGLGQDAPLDLAADSNHIVKTVPVRNVRDPLVQDRPGIELLGDVMRRSPDDFHPALIRPAGTGWLR